MGQIAKFYERMAALQRLETEQPFRVIAPCPAPAKPHTLTHPIEEYRLKQLLPLN